LFEFEELPTTSEHAYIVFETIYSQKEVKTIHVVSNEREQKASIGRAFDAGMRVPDISVSRYHANIEYKNDHFYLSDNESKFGTLLLLKQPLVIDPKVFRDPSKPASET
jgi:pSer/pThr/pTyr-binding forkhead associated (FHA) protein